MEYYVNDKRRAIQERKLQAAHRKLSWDAKLRSAKEIGLAILFFLGVMAVAFLCTEIAISAGGGG